MIRFSRNISMETIYRMVASQNLVLCPDYQGGAVIKTRADREAEIEIGRQLRSALTKAKSEAATNATVVPIRRLRRINGKRRPSAPDPYTAA